MRIIFAEDHTAIAQAASERIIRLLQTKPQCVLGLATGASPIGLYQTLVQQHRDNVISFAQATSFNLDEYVGLDAAHPQSFRYFMEKHLFHGVDFGTTANYFPTLVDNPEHYDQTIAKAGGIDLQVLGIGSNGHIGFNEPGTDWHSLTHVVQLTEQTRQDNARFFPSLDAVPQKAITMGIGTIMMAREIVVIAMGPRKANAVVGMVKGAITPDVPASILQQHPQVTLIIDAAAGSKLKVIED